METETLLRARAQWTQIAGELAGADASWASGNAGRGRVGARRAAGMALAARLTLEPRPAYGTSFMHHLNALADDAEAPVALREAAWRLSARPIPPQGFEVSLPPGLTPMADARAIVEWVAAAAPALGG